MNRLYIIKYKFYKSQGSAFKYSPSPVYEERMIFYKKEERGEWIKEYLRLISPEKEMYIEDVVCYYVDQFHLIEDMNEVINAI